MHIVTVPIKLNVRQSATECNNNAVAEQDNNRLYAYIIVMQFRKKYVLAIGYVVKNHLGSNKIIFTKLT